MLYHGSKNLIENYLEPRVSYEMKPLVYATDDWCYALLRCGNFDITKFLIREDYDEATNKLSLAEIVPGAFKYLFDRTGYIYELDERYFVFNHDTEYISEDYVPISRCTVIDNVWNEIQKHLDRFELIFYENSDAYWKTVRGGREGYLDRKRKGLKEMGLMET